MKQSIMEVSQMLPDGTLAELINGSVYMSPAPSTEHQRIVRELAFALWSFTKQKKLAKSSLHRMTSIWTIIQMLFNLI